MHENTESELRAAFRDAGLWRDGWTYYGAVECRNCWQAEVLAVVCSDACREAFKPSDPALRLELAAEDFKHAQGADR